MTVDADKRPGATSRVQSDAAPSTAASSPGKQTLTGQLPPAPTTYTVRPGDTLPTIAAKLHTTVEALTAANADQLKRFPTRTGGTVETFTAGAVIHVPPPAPAPAAAKPAEPGLLARGWEFFFGSSSKAPGANTKDAAAPADAARDDHAAHDKPAPAAAHDKPAPADAAHDNHATNVAASPANATATAPLAELSNAQRGEQLSTFGAGEVPADPRARPDAAAGAAEKRGQWLGAGQVAKAGTGKSGAAFVDAIDKMNDGAQFTPEQDQVIAAARTFAASPQPLTAAQERHAAVDWSRAQLTLDGVSLDADLKARVTRFIRFAAWANLVTGPTPVSSVMRSPADAHRLSVAWMFSPANNMASSLNNPSGRQKLVTNVTAHGGTDSDRNSWLRPATVDGLKARKDNDAALEAFITSDARPDAAKVKSFHKQAAEGYTDDRRQPNILPGNKVSNHLKGEAVDMTPPWVFNNLYDPLIDALAAYFGLHRPLKDSRSSPEHWHYERLGAPPGAEHHDD